MKHNHNINGNKPAARVGRPSIVALSSDASIRSTYYYRIRTGQDIEAELESELVRRFPTYDAETHSFGHHQMLKNNKDSIQNLSNNKLITQYQVTKLNGLPISDELHLELINRFPNCYDAQNRILTKTVSYAKPETKQKHVRNATSHSVQPRRPQYTSKLITQYQVTKINGLPINDELHLELIHYFPQRYDAQKRVLITHQKLREQNIQKQKQK